MRKHLFGLNLNKWYICRCDNGEWAICPPSKQVGGGIFPSGAAALEAFAHGR